MRGSPVVFYTVESATLLPNQLEVGAFYCISDTGIIRVNHGNGDIVDYGIGLTASNALATNASPGLVTGSNDEGFQSVDELGRMVMPLAQVGRRGGIRAAETMPTEYTDGWKIGVDPFGNAYVSSRTANEAAALANANQPSAVNPLATLAEVRAHEQDVDTAINQEVAIRGAQIQAETEARRVMESALTERIDSVIGKVLYLPSTDFGTATPTQEQFTAYAKSFTGLDYVENGTSVKNEFDGSEWIFSEATNNGSWVNQGNSTIATASNTSLGLAKGDAVTEGGVQVRVDGSLTTEKASVNRYGGVRVKEVTSTVASAIKKVSLDSEGTAFFNAFNDNQIGGIQAASNPSWQNPVVTKSVMDATIAAAELRWNA